MRPSYKPVLALVAIGVFSIAAVQSTAQDQQKKERKKGNSANPIAKMIERLELTPDQKAKFDEIHKEYAPQMAAIQKRRAAIMTPERKRAEKEAMKAAKDAGKTGKEGRLVADAALNLSPTERGELDAIRKEQRELLAKISEQLRTILTPEQKAKLPDEGKKKKKKES
jgi:Spy/CpxP family protein refolding chaperone